MISCKCKGCERRYVGCHSSCDDYKLFKESRAKELEQMKHKRNYISDYIGYKKQCSEKIRRSYGRSYG